jgi:hypothetical protein
MVVVVGRAVLVVLVVPVVHLLGEDGGGGEQTGDHARGQGGFGQLHVLPLFVVARPQVGLAAVATASL